MYAGGAVQTVKLPNGSMRRFDDLLSHRKNIVKDSHRIEAFNAFFAVLRECFGPEGTPPKDEVLEIYGRILINSFNIMNDEYQPVGIGLYLEASVLDHSCRPSANVVFQGKKLLLRTIVGGIKNFDDVRYIRQRKCAFLAYSKLPPYFQNLIH